MHVSTNAPTYAVAVVFNNGTALGGSMEIMGTGALIAFNGNETYSLPSGKALRRNARSIAPPCDSR